MGNDGQSGRDKTPWQRLEGEPAPGSDEAIALGCLCPVTNNHSGAGYVVREGVVTYWQNMDCPLHGAKSGYRVIRDSSPAEAWDA